MKKWHFAMLFDDSWLEFTAPPNVGSVLKWRWSQGCYVPVPDVREPLCNTGFDYGLVEDRPDWEEEG